MSIDEWIKIHEKSFGSHYEHLFVKNVLAHITSLDLKNVSTQYQFKDLDGCNRYCDFVIQEGQIRIAIEIDGFDKRNTGKGMNHDEFVDWQRRQASLTSYGWHVLRFANRDVSNEPKLCIQCIEKLLNDQRTKIQEQIIANEKKLHDSTLQTLPSDDFKKLNLKSISVWVFGLVLLSATYKIFNTDSNETNLNTQPQKNIISDKCKNSKNWSESINYIGQYITVKGHVTSFYHHTNGNGKPTWISLGEKYPSKNRLSIVVWGKDSYKFGKMLSPKLVASEVCVKGFVKLYNGIAEIEISKPEDLLILDEFE